MKMSSMRCGPGYTEDERNFLRKTFHFPCDNLKSAILLLIAVFLAFLIFLTVFSREKAEVSIIELDAKWTGGEMLCSSGPMMNMLEGTVVACDAEKCVVVARTWIFAPLQSVQPRDVEVKVGELVKTVHMQRRGSYIETNPLLIVAPPGTEISIKNTSLSFTVPSCLKKSANKPPVRMIIEGNESQDWGTVQLEGNVVKFERISKSVLLIKPSSDIELDISGTWGNYSFKAPSGKISLVVLPGSFSVSSSGREILRG